MISPHNKELLFRLKLRYHVCCWWCRPLRRLRPSLIIAVTLLLIVLMGLIRGQGCWIEKYRSRLFCFVLTDDANLESRARAVYETWGRQCGRFVFVGRLNSSRECKYKSDQGKQKTGVCDLPVEEIKGLPEENYSHLADKVRLSLLHFDEHYGDFDWYLKADDDTYVIVDNLIRFLVSASRKYPRPLLYGYRFREDFYVSGGAGYVLTRPALEMFSSHMKSDAAYSRCKSTMEDFMVGKCLQQVLQSAPLHETRHFVLVGETVDRLGRERFHPLTFRVHFNAPSNKTQRQWIHDRPFHHALFGSEAFSDTTISLHYTQPEDMYQMHAFIYQIRRLRQQVCRSPP